MGCADTKWFCLPIEPTPVPPTPRPPLRGPISGVTTGAPALAGEVGEFIQRSVTATITVASNAVGLVTVNPLTLGPGDWDVEAKLDLAVQFTGAQFILNPTVPGMSSDMRTSGFLPGVLHQIPTASIQSLRNQLLTSLASSVLQFDITVANFTAASVTGNYTFTVNARRMR